MEVPRFSIALEAQNLRMFSPLAQKLGVLLLSLLTVGVASLGVVSVKTRIGKPFYKPKVAQTPAVNEEMRLKGQDTDRDGLSDWDELNLYNTSAYLDDTDSDGFTDKTEIESGNDPNCPTGKDCALFSSSYTATSTAPSALPIPVPTISGLFGSAVLGTKPDPESIRRALIESGINPKYLEQVDDAALLKLYEETLAETEEKGPLPNLSQLSPQEMRALLHVSGVDPKVLQKLSDEELYALVGASLSTSTSR